MTETTKLCDIDPDVASEFPGLRLWQLAVDATPGRSTPGVKQRLRELSNRMTGAKAVTMRQEAVPHAYRVFFRHVGLDPDVVPTPIEQAILDRLKHGGFRARSAVDDALLLALVETGVPVMALDDATLSGDLELRPARPDDAFVPAGRLAVADAGRAVAELFGPVDPEVAVTAATTRLRLFAVAPRGVPAIHAEEALEEAVTALADRR